MRLFSPLKVGPFNLEHRVVMPPLTRMRASADGVPSPFAAVYYGQRATEGGLIIGEATQISRQGQGYPQTPGIFTAAQVAGWQEVTRAVHEKGGVMFLQLWHVGRISHSSLQENGALPVAPSAVRPAGNAFTPSFGRVPFETPHALEVVEIQKIISDYRNAAAHAKEAGFDGVEVHGANGYLLQQFLEDKTNRRIDSYGGTVENRARLLFEVLDAVAEVWPIERIGVRLSPYCQVGDIEDSNPEELYSYVTERLSVERISYLHLIESQTSWATASAGSVKGPSLASVASLFRPHFTGPIIASGGFSPDSAEEALKADTVDMIAFGRPFIANPDLPRRLQLGAALNLADSSTFYGGGEKGYTDYPRLV
ncbi:alkene reductase [Caballeronia sp. NCTM5]|uniref:alkene reductase n=1 Tax=Caballeronia sp. NCTM5 TaxID=2921755 RepID=UPI002028A358|nr:alkene reductase [Caballeronia sp. NCTM5]